jgi:hypothetical protein
MLISFTGYGKKYRSLWNAIFNLKQDKQNSWLHAAQRHNVHPILVGSKVKGNLVLLAFDWSGNLQREREKFFASLQKHECDACTEEITFDCGIKLNVRQVLTGS